MTNFNTQEMLTAIEEMERCNYAMALQLLLPLAQAGNPRAQCNIAVLYHFGLGVSSNAQNPSEKC
jgi:TPR repeat protein